MKEITEEFGRCYYPQSAFLVVYENGSYQKDIYIESYNFDANGCPINAHPLSLKERRMFAKALDQSGDFKRGYLKPKGLLPENVLYLNPESNGFAVWYTGKQQAHLFFKEDLGIANGQAWISPLLWKATKESLSVYALIDTGKPNVDSILYHAPFFNIYEDGKVCMGTVKIDIADDCTLDDFIARWEQYFFNSYFSHLLRQRSPVKGNIISLWQSLIGSHKKFPLKELTPNKLTLKNILS
ncbi:PRTRC system protein B [Pedobacter nutrimenti]|uniref:PRTRC system protein B n=1 Tax=Pedobacter nutrimenti TaxID=1241337 RepID=UPI00292D3E44|nr:PRTRC system protein B [Pedobacter nutrimenti]